MFPRETSKSKTGRIGEDLTCKYLAGKRYEILARNYRKPWGEIDIVAKAPDKTLVFVEVKTMHDVGEAGLTPEDQMSSSKLIKLKRTCEKFVAKNEGLLNENRGWRIDLVAITLGERKPEVRHYENVV